MNRGGAKPNSLIKNKKFRILILGPTCGLFNFQLIGNADQQTRVRDPDD
jgi:hypothetical protein